MKLKELVRLLKVHLLQTVGVILLPIVLETLIQPTPQQQDAYLAQMRQQVQVQFMQDLIHKVTDQCYKKCTTPSGSGLTSREKDCMANCMDRYMETMQIVNATLSERGGGR